MCMRCLCCCCCSFFFVLFLLAGTIASLYIFIDPKLPTYGIDNFDVKSFEMKSDNKLQVEAAVDIKANNPNTGIAFEYEKDSAIDVIFSGTTLCSGQIPAFYQPVKNITNMNIVLKGQSDFGPDLQQDLLQQRKNGQVTIHMKVKIPVRVVILDIRLSKLVVDVNGTMVVTDVVPGNKINVLSSKYYYDFQL